jgi:hypothetical protein
MEDIIDCVLKEDDRELLDRMFSLEEIKVAVFQMKHNKAQVLMNFIRSSRG